MDWVVNQTDIKFFKGKSGVVFKGISTKVICVWTQTMHRCAVAVTDAVSTILTEKC